VTINNIHFKTLTVRQVDTRKSDEHSSLCVCVCVILCMNVFFIFADLNTSYFSLHTRIQRKTSDTYKVSNDSSM